MSSHQSSQIADTNSANNTSLNPRECVGSSYSLAELTQGLDQLREDIATDKIKQIIAQYESNIGDYLFVIAEKN